MNCWSEGRPLLERHRNLNITCLALDCLFVLIYGATAVKKQHVVADKEQCYMDHHYSGHITESVIALISGLISAVGAVTHGMIAYAISAKEHQVRAVSRYGHILIIWFVVEFLLSALSGGQEPEECAALDPPKAATNDVSDDEIWQVCHALLWIAWVVLVVAATMQARRLLMFWGTIQAQQSAVPGSSPAWSQSQGSAGASPQTVGVPMGVPIDGAGPPTNSLGSGAAGAAGGSWPAAGGRSWPAAQGAVAAGGGVVAQGRPVPGSTPDPTKVDKGAAEEFSM